MPRHKSARNVPLKPWLCANRDCRDGRFIMVGNSLLLSEPFKKLSGNAQKTYFALCMESGGGNTASLSYTAGAAKYGISKNTFGRAIKELLDAGFISCAFEDNPNMYQTNVYRFCLDWRPP